MVEYKIEIHFNDVDDNFYTKGQVKMKFDVTADDFDTAYHLGERIRRQFGADSMLVIVPEEKVSITAEMVSHLRDKSDCPMMECKKALVASNGDMNKAMEWLRTRHLHRTYLT